MNRSTLEWGIGAAFGIRTETITMQMLNNLDRRDRWIRRAVARNLSTQDAFNLEHTLILCYGRKDIGTGILVNKNNGVGIDLRNVSSPASTPASSALGRPLATAAFLFVLLISSLIVGPLLAPGPSAA